MLKEEGRGFCSSLSNKQPAVFDDKMEARLERTGIGFCVMVGVECKTVLDLNTEQDRVPRGLIRRGKHEEKRRTWEKAIFGEE